MREDGGNIINGLNDNKDQNSSTIVIYHAQWNVFLSRYFFFFSLHRFTHKFSTNQLIAKRERKAIKRISLWSIFLIIKPSAFDKSFKIELKEENYSNANWKLIALIDFSLSINISLTSSISLSMFCRLLLSLSQLFYYVSVEWYEIKWLQFNLFNCNLMLNFSISHVYISHWIFSTTRCMHTSGIYLYIATEINYPENEKLNLFSSPLKIS